MESPALEASGDGRTQLVIPQIGHAREESEPLHVGPQRIGIRLAWIPTGWGGLGEGLERSSMTIFVRVVGRHGDLSRMMT